MRRALIGSAMALLFSAAVGAQATTQQPPPTPPQTQQTQATEVTLVGCVVKGTTENVFILEDAVDPADKEAAPRTLKLASAGEELDFLSHVNQKVQFVGTIAPRTAAAAAAQTGQQQQQQEQKIDEKNLQVFTVKTVTPVATTCSTAGQ